jgi:hypothetical protein
VSIIPVCCSSKWRKVFSETESNCLPKHQPWDLTIDFIEDAPKMMDCKIYPLTLDEQGKMREYIHVELEKQFIRHSKSPICSPPFFVGKKDGQQHLVIDYRKVNVVMVPVLGPIPLLQEEIDEVKDAQLFTKLDIRTGYNNIRIREGDEHKAAFKTNMGLFEPVVMPFGLRNVPAVFQHMMNTQFTDLIATGMVQVYIDDILIATVDDPTVHRPIVCKVLDRLQEMDMYLKPSKCYFEVHKIEFLGMILENGMVTMDMVKVAGVAKWKEPKNVRDVRKFLRFCNFYCRFIRGFSQIMKPLNNLLKKGAKWTWEKVEQGAFDKLKRQVTEEPVLMQPNQKKQFKIKVNASNYTIGAVLMQKSDKNILHPVAFFSKTMNNVQRNYDVYKYNCELLVLVETFRHWRHYLHSPAHQICHEP